ncbi:MAG: nucleotidyltransferase domain-containing protein [Solirubrobacteraceae bacterium]|nr:nucleotidyltransferase domain-containing protein [Solirubrobacteraceae bacterium]
MTDESVHSREPDSARARAIAERGLILKTTVGSEVHGLSNPGTDDDDQLGVAIEPAAYLLGFQRFEHFVYRTQPDGMPSGPGDLDLTVYGLRKFCGLALKGSPTVLLPLFVTEGAFLLQRTALGEELQSLAPAFVARSTGRAFLGYLSAQRRGLLGDREATSRQRERSAEHGYDTKYAMHCLRIGVQGIELLTTGRITLPVPGTDHALLRAVRSGEPELPEVLGHIDRVTAELEAVTAEADVPERPAIDEVDAFVTRAYRTTWDAWDEAHGT